MQVFEEVPSFMTWRALVSHNFVFVYMQEFSCYILEHVELKEITVNLIKIISILDKTVLDWCVATKNEKKQGDMTNFVVVLNFTSCKFHIWKLIFLTYGSCKKRLCYAMCKFGNWLTKAYKIIWFPGVSITLVISSHRRCIRQLWPLKGAVRPLFPRESGGMPPPLFGRIWNLEAWKCDFQHSEHQKNVLFL